MQSSFLARTNRAKFLLVIGEVEVLVGFFRVSKNGFWRRELGALAVKGLVGVHMPNS